MKIKTIEINNYKAFYGNYKIPVEGKNLFIYGENGSGKSSFFYALKDFFQSTTENIEFNEVENIFIPDSKKGNCFIKIKFISINGKKKEENEFKLDRNSSEILKKNLDLRKTNDLKSFLSYKNLLDIHHLKKHQEINLFNLLVKGVLRHFKYSLTGDKELGSLWQDVENSIITSITRKKLSDKKDKVNTALKIFNNAFSELFDENSHEYILKHTQPILDRFNHNVSIKLRYTKARPNDEYKEITDNHVHIEVMYAGKKVENPHMFLNEARLSAIAISIYLGMIKRHPQLIPYKILFLDDIFIGLDISNRLPLMKILEDEFKEFQIFLTTYDKPWFEYIKSFLDGKNGWKTMEFYSVLTNKSYEIPKIFDNQDFLKKAEWHLTNGDYKSAAVYTRSEFERILCKYCEDKEINIPFKLKFKSYKSEDFWNEISRNIELSLKNEIEKYRELVLNPFSHYNIEKHEIKSELNSAIEAVKDLKDKLNNQK